MSVFEMTMAEGRGLTVIVTELDLTHPFEFVSVNVYELVEVGDTEGFAAVELNPETGLAHE